MAEEVGLEPTHPEGRNLFSKQGQYQILLTLPFTDTLF